MLVRNLVVTLPSQTGAACTCDAQARHSAGLFTLCWCLSLYA